MTSSTYDSLRRGVGRPSKAQPFRRLVVDLLLENPQMKSLEIVRRAKLAGYEGGKIALYALIASVRPRRSRPFGMQDRIPGEISRHGFAQAEVRLGNGRTQLVNLFVSRLEYSRFVAASVVPEQSVEVLVRTLIEHFGVMGGIP